MKPLHPEIVENHSESKIDFMQIILQIASNGSKPFRLLVLVTVILVTSSCLF